MMKYRNIKLSTLVVLVVCTASTVPMSTGAENEEEEGNAELEDLKAQLGTLMTNVQDLTETVSAQRTMITKLSRQTMLQQFGVEERTRNDGNSGIRLIRSRKHGLKNYESPSFVGFSLYAIHDHANYIRTMGIGEVVVSMNGVEFRTRHNDYKLVMPSTTSTDFHAVEPIPFPEVPPSVTGSVEEQRTEMALWFKAFKEQDRSERDYTKYFKPVFCYMEGAWTLDTSNISEPFKSERHQLDASSWFDLQEKTQYAALSGTKNAKENLAYLPTTILKVNEETGEAEYGQWNYRILCKPLDRDIPLMSLHYVEDLAYRMKDSKTAARTLQTRAARFKLYDETMADDYQLLDEIFYTVPGADNIPSDDMRQQTFGEGDLYDVRYKDRNVLLKNGYYHRQYKYQKKGAMGLAVNPRGFNDENAWVAQTTQSKVAPVCLEVCQREEQPNGKRPKICRDHCSRFTYAIPMEIVYLTPLLSWNPYNITIHQDKKSAIANGGDGSQIPFNGADDNRYYLTPAEMFSKGAERGKADTTKGAVKIYDSEGKVKDVTATGTRIFTDPIEGVGQVRLRFPIAPVADEGSSVWKELTALKDLFYSLTGSEEEVTLVEPPEVTFQMAPSGKFPPGDHTHDLTISFSQFRDRLMNGKMVEVTTEMALQHDHNLRMRYNKQENRFYYTTCNNKNLCSDGHPKDITLTSENSMVRSLLARAQG